MRFTPRLIPIIACGSLWLVLMLLAACGATEIACASPTQTVIAAGATLYSQPEMCATCHPGGNAGVGPQLRGTDQSQNRVAGIIRDGRGDMHGYSAARVPDVQACQLAAYVKSLK